MSETNEIIIKRINNIFQKNCKYNSVQQNVWVMAAAAIPFAETPKNAHLLPYALPGSRDYRGKEDDEIRQAYMDIGIPTHIVRVVLRTTDQNGTCDYVDGTDLFMIVDEEKQTAEFVWEDLWIEGPPIFHGGTVPDALAWVRELAEPFYLQLKDPFLTPEQRIALNGHDEDYKMPEVQIESAIPKVVSDDDFDKWF
jgi:hypothetical protein